MPKVAGAHKLTAVPNLLHKAVGAPKLALTAVRSTVPNVVPNAVRNTVPNVVPNAVVRWLTISTFIIFASFAISLLTVGHRCYYDSDKTWTNDAQVCLRVIITGIVMMFVVCVIIVIDMLFCIIRCRDG